MQGDLSVREALGLAMVRRVTRLAAIRDELADLGWESFIAPKDLALLEDHGFLLDFETGRVVDTLAAVDATVNSSVATVNGGAVPA